MKSLAATLVVCLGTTALFAAPPQPQQKSQATDDKQVVAVDPSGQFRGVTVERAVDLSAQAKKPMNVLRPEVTSVGSAHIALDDTYDFYYVARTDEDGYLTFTCIDNKDAASKFVASAASIDTVLRIRPVPTVRPRAERE